MIMHPGRPTDDEQDAAAEAFYGVDALKLDETDLRLLLSAVLLKIETAERERENPFAYTRLAQRLRDEMARKTQR